MSGGFFRGTSADQDTRFSNKQAKLLKSQKYAPELENLVDMTKVKMDVMKPWIAKRVTELIGFEDEVLINFIYGLLEGEAVNGKQIQISLTGFMERNTGKFMKELWSLLISAQQNVSGVPQQFLDAKEVETQKKKAETDRVANEIHRKKEKEKQEFQEEKAKMDGDGTKSRVAHSDLEPNVKRDARGSTIHKADEKERYKRNGRRRSSRDSRSPDSPYHLPSSSERRRLRSISGTPPSKSCSISSERRARSPPRRSMTPRRRHVSRRSPSLQRHVKQRSRSHSQRRSPSPARYRVRSPRRHRSRSPMHRRSRSPVRRRSRTPIRRSPIQYWSRAPLRRRSPSPILSRSPSPIRRSPSFERQRLQSPVHRRSSSPMRRRSPSPVRRQSPSPVRRRSRSPMRRCSPFSHNQSPSPARRRYRRSLSTSSQKSISPARRRSFVHDRKRSFTPASRRSPSPQESSSPSHIRRSSLSLVRRGSLKLARSPVKSPGERARRHEKYSPTRRASPSERAEIHSGNRKGIQSAERRPVLSLRSPQRDVLDQIDVRGKQRNFSPSMPKSPSGSDASRGRSYSEEQRSISPRGSPHLRRDRIVPPDSPNPSRRAVDTKAQYDNSGTSADDENNLSSRELGGYKNTSSGKKISMLACEKGLHDTDDIHHLTDGSKSRRSQLTYSDRPHEDADQNEHRERRQLSSIIKTSDVCVKSGEYDNAARANKDKKIAQAEDDEGSYQFRNTESLPKFSKKQNDQNGSLDSALKETDEPGGKVKEKREKKSDRQDADSDDYSSYDSYDERKEAKKRRKEEKKLKKETRRRRRDEKHRRRDERRAKKLKLKSGDVISSPSDQSEEESGKMRELRASNSEETLSEKKRLEIELREKALKSLRAKNGVGN